jgi:hypothetical protein
VLAHVAAEIAAALAAAHAPDPCFPHGARGPTAVMVTPQGTIKVIDLGLRASVLTPQEIAARPAHGPYAAPELANPSPPVILPTRITFFGGVRLVSARSCGNFRGGIPFDAPGSRREQPGSI